jgi:hypothetical protein
MGLRCRSIDSDLYFEELPAVELDEREHLREPHRRRTGSRPQPLPAGGELVAEAIDQRAALLIMDRYRLPEHIGLVGHLPCPPLEAGSERFNLVGRDIWRAEAEWGRV